ATALPCPDPASRAAEPWAGPPPSPGRRPAPASRGRAAARGKACLNEASWSLPSLEPSGQKQLKDIGLVRIQLARAHIGEVVVLVADELVIEIQGCATEAEAIVEQQIAGL